MTPLGRKYTIGRSPTCDIVLADESVSRIHAELIFLEDGKLLLTDCHSTQGTGLMNHGGEARPIRQVLITLQDTLRFGAVSMPVKELLHAINLKYLPLANSGSTHKNALRGASKPLEGEALVRCKCGAVKVKNTRCAVCGA